MLAAPLDDLDVVVVRAREGAIADEDLREPQDGVERRAELVAHRREEETLRAVGPARVFLRGARTRLGRGELVHLPPEGDRPLGDPLLEDRVAPLERVEAIARDRGDDSADTERVQRYRPPGEPRGRADAECGGERPRLAPREVARPDAEDVRSVGERRVLVARIARPGAGARLEPEELRSVLGLRPSKELGEDVVERDAALVIGQDGPRPEQRPAPREPRRELNRRERPFRHLRGWIEDGDAAHRSRPDPSSPVHECSSAIAFVRGEAVLGRERPDRKRRGALGARRARREAGDALVREEVDGAVAVVFDLVDGVVRDRGLGGLGPECGSARSDRGGRETTRRPLVSPPRAQRPSRPRRGRRGARGRYR